MQSKDKQELLLQDQAEQDELGILRYSQTMMRPNIVRENLNQILRIYEKGTRNVQNIIAAFGTRSGNEDIQQLAAYTQTLLTTSNSINRVLHQLETTLSFDVTEMVAGKYRHLAASADPVERRTLYESIQIKKGAGEIMVYLPFLPGRRQVQRQFIYDLLFRRLIDKGPYPQWPRVHILFTHVYSTQLKRFPKDVDNFNYKPAIDLLAAAMSFSDSAISCSLEQRAEFRDDLPAGVYITVQPIQWTSGADTWLDLSAD